MDNLNNTSVSDETAQKYDIGAAVAANQVDPDTLPPALKYEGDEDPELNIDAAITEAYNRPLACETLNESADNKFYIAQALKAYLQQIGYKMDSFDMDTFIEKYVPAENKFYHDPQHVQMQLNKLLLNLKANPAFALLLQGNADMNEVTAPAAKFNASNLTGDAARLFNAYQDSEDEIASVEESVEQKFNSVYLTSKRILNGKAIKHHAFICGDPGVGKCVSGDTLIPIRVDDIIAEEIEAWMKSQKFFMKTLNISLADLYEFCATKTPSFTEGDESFVDPSFTLEIKDENGNWIPSHEVCKKQADLYEVKFDDGRSFKAAGDHIFTFDPNVKVHSFVKDLQVGDKLQYGNLAEITSITKIADKADVYSPMACSQSHLYQDTNGFIHHNTYSVKQAVKDAWDSSPLNTRDGYEIVYKAGDLGTTPAPLVAFFYKNAMNKVIILDDCDAFVLAKDQRLQNLLKAMLDTDNTKAHPRPISVSPGIRMLASKYIADDSKQLDTSGGKKGKKKEGMLFQIDQAKLKEGIMSLKIDGQVVGDFELNEDELSLFQTSPRVRENAHNSAYNLKRDMYGIYREAQVDDDPAKDSDVSATASEYDDLNEDDVDELAEDKEAGLLDTNDGSEGIPPEFIFNSRLIMISNLMMSDVNDAVLSRCDTVEITLTHEEFMCRLGQILPNLMTDSETETPKWQLDYAKNTVYGLFAAVMQLKSQGGGIFGKPILVNVPLQFRMIGDLSGRWLLRCDKYCDDNGIEPSPKTLPKIATAIERQFIKFDLLTLLAGDRRLAKKK